MESRKTYKIVMISATTRETQECIKEMELIATCTHSKNGQSLYVAKDSNNAYAIVCYGLLNPKLHHKQSFEENPFFKFAQDADAYIIYNQMNLSFPTIKSFKDFCRNHQIIGINPSKDLSEQMVRVSQKKEALKEQEKGEEKEKEKEQITSNQSLKEEAEKPSTYTPIYWRRKSTAELNNLASDEDSINKNKFSKKN